MPGFLTDLQVSAAVLDELQKTNATATATLEPWWSGIVTRANAWAYNEILSRLLARGYLLAQVTGWDRGAEFQIDLAVWQAFRVAAVRQPATYNMKGLEYRDRRDELTGRKDVTPVDITAAGVYQDPLGTAGQPNTGGFDTSRDRVVFPDPEDPQLGRPSHF